jgi:hypothetical protein
MISSLELSNQTDTHSQLINSSQPLADQPELFENLSVDHHPPPQVQRNLTTIENTHENQQIPNQKRPIDDVYNPEPRKVSVPKITRAKKPKQNRQSTDHSWVPFSPKYLTIYSEAQFLPFLGLSQLKTFH